MILAYPLNPTPIIFNRNLEDIDGYIKYFKNAMFHETYAMVENKIDEMKLKSGNCYEFKFKSNYMKLKYDGIDENEEAKITQNVYKLHGNNDIIFIFPKTNSDT